MCWVKFPCNTQICTLNTYSFQICLFKVVIGNMGLIGIFKYDMPTIHMHAILIFTMYLNPQTGSLLFAAVLLLLLQPIQIEEVDPVFQIGGLTCVYRLHFPRYL